jgi:hypothetical protein
MEARVRFELTADVKSVDARLDWESRNVCSSFYGRCWRIVKEGQHIDTAQTMTAARMAKHDELLCLGTTVCLMLQRSFKCTYQINHAATLDKTSWSA